MEFEIQNDILVPKTALPPIYIFIDETYLLDHSGFLQSAIPVPQNIYSEQLVPLCADLLRTLGRDAKEFKGSAIKHRNSAVYREFLSYFVNVAAHISDHADLFPVASVDSTDRYFGGNFDRVFNNVIRGLANIGICDEEQLAAEFSRQILWVHSHYKKISPTELANELILCFDNKHQYAQRMQALRALTSDRLIAPTFWQLEKAITSFANTLFARIEPAIPIARVGRFHFQWSPVEFGLQAADLLCHLLYNAIKYEMGILDDKTELKYKILKDVMPSFALDSSLRSCLAVAKDHQGRDDVRCVDSQLLSTFQFKPT